MSEIIAIHNSDFWFKVVDMLQQNWAVIEQTDDMKGSCILFIDDNSGVFDKIVLASRAEAIEALRRNGFQRLADDKDGQAFLRPPVAPYTAVAHPNGPIYSSGRFWR